MTPVQVLHVLEATEGGVARFVIDATSRQSGQRVLAVRWRYATDVLQERLANAGVEYEEVPIWRLLVSRRPWRRMRDANVTFLHSGVAGVIGRIAAVVRVVRGKRLVYVPHASIGYTSRFRAGMERFLTRTARDVDLLFVSPGEREDFATRFGPLSGGRTHVVAPFANSTATGDIGADDPPPVKLVSIGRLVEQKNPAAVAKLLNGLARAGIKFEFTWIGDGPLRHSFLQALEPSSREQVRVSGWVNDAMKMLRDIRPHFAVSLSRYEGSSYATLDALDLGIPFIVTPIAGNRHLVRDGIEGFVFDDRILRRLESCFSDGSYERMRGEALRTAAAFTPERFDSEIVAVLRAKTAD